MEAGDIDGALKRPQFFLHEERLLEDRARPAPVVSTARRRALRRVEAVTAREEYSRVHGDARRGVQERGDAKTEWQNIDGVPDDRAREAAEKRAREAEM